ncbi:MAG TPA: hypothetical protein VGA34_13315 [Alteraurantiacibacter sp.]|jgi:hypothetical protein
MIDYFTIALTHGLIAVAAWRLLFRDDLDSDREVDATDEAHGRTAGKRADKVGSDDA